MKNHKVEKTLNAQLSLRKEIIQATVASWATLELGTFTRVPNLPWLNCADCNENPVIEYLYTCDVLQITPPYIFVT